MLGIKFFYVEEFAQSMRKTRLYRTAPEFLNSDENRRWETEFAIQPQDDTIQPQDDAIQPQNARCKSRTTRSNRRTPHSNRKKTQSNRRTTRSNRKKTQSNRRTTQSNRRTREPLSMFRPTDGADRNTSPPGASLIVASRFRLIFGTPLR
ncbi:unnamed protein product, partial [Nesidiocoris tenuis]